MDELSEETKERYRRWWVSRSPEDRARLRALNGKPVTIHELVFLGDSQGFPLGTAPGQADDPIAALHLSADSPPAAFCLPDFLLDDQSEEGTADRPG